MSLDHTRKTIYCGHETVRVWAVLEGIVGATGSANHV